MIRFYVLFLLCIESALPFAPILLNDAKRKIAFLRSSSDFHQDVASVKDNRDDANVIQKDIVIIGAGLAGLSVAFHIAENSRRKVTILDKEDPIKQMQKTTAGSFAAAGMLAPNSERLPSGPLLEFCLKSRDMYPDFVRSIEGVVKDCGSEANRLLWNDDRKSDDLYPWQVGYMANGGFLAPAFAGDSVATWSPPDQNQNVAIWLDEIQIHEMEPLLHPEVIGGWWFPEDSSVDARRLTCALRAACFEKGVNLMLGNDFGVRSLELADGTCRQIHLDNGQIIAAKDIVVANGSWMRNLLPVPITPHKGQSLSLRMPTDAPPMLSRVLFAQDTYIVPKADGRIVVGATVEAGSFDPSVTPSGIMHCINNALELMPGLADLPIEETWAGLRPTTPDKAPILGRSRWKNLFLAGGYWRNGVLLAPKSGQLIGDLVLKGGGKLDNDEDELFIDTFNWNRFTNPGGGKTLAANTRYAASMHPIHKRSSGIGVATAVGTELGFYSGADAAAEERQKDREALFSDSSISTDGDSAFEKAAKLGLEDAASFSFSEILKPSDSTVGDRNVNDDATNAEGYYDYAPSDDKDETNVATLENTETQASSITDPEQNSFDGYQAIEAANSRGSREEELEVMKKVRMANRLDIAEIQRSKIGVMKRPESPPLSVEDSNNKDSPAVNGIEVQDDAVEQKGSVNSSEVSAVDVENLQTSQNNMNENISELYDKIKNNKVVGKGVAMEDIVSEDRPDPGFRIYHVDSETNEEFEVPPYTSPNEIDGLIAKQLGTNAKKEL